MAVFQRYTEGMYDPGEQVMLLDKHYTRDGLFKELKRIEQTLANASEDDLLIFLHSGHARRGPLTRSLSGPEFEILSYDGPVNWRELDSLRSLRCQVVCLLDCARSGAVIDYEVGLARQQVTKQAENFNILAAARSEEEAYERYGLSVFSEAVIQGLSGAADSYGDRDGLITFQELCRYVQSRPAMPSEPQFLSARRDPLPLVWAVRPITPIPAL
jgi:hypothetical protein